MGHTKLGPIPKSKKWNVVVSEVLGEGSSIDGTLLSDDIENIASITLSAAEGGLNKALSDPGLIYSFYLLTQIALASRDHDWTNVLIQHGLFLDENCSIFDLTAEAQGAIDDYILANYTSTDISEIAQKSVGEAIFSLGAPKAFTLFGGTGENLRHAIRGLSTKKGFGELSQVFFGRFMAKFLNFYLSRVTASEVDSPRLPSADDISEFNESLESHCEQSAKIVRDFAAEWYSKTEYLEGIDLDNTSRFLAIAIKKLQSELARQRDVE